VETYPGFFHLELELPPDYPTAWPGQYLNLRAGTALDPLFRRPFGVVEFRREAGAAVVELYYGVVGGGTQTMAGWRTGDAVDCLGPLGNPYRVDPDRPAILVGGGRGAAPLLYLNRLLREQGHPDTRFALGARTAGMLFGLERLDQKRLLISTEDGSAGHRGTIVEALEEEETWLREPGTLYACGPEAFLAATAALARRHGWGCQVSLEGIYACGLGLCRGCAVPLKGEVGFLMQCVDGPVVDADRIDWDRMPE
jgi:dihydroorotate dehydrogenase electron transfer subunit